MNITVCMIYFSAKKRYIDLPKFIIIQTGCPLGVLNAVL